jgi:hypothetical protein
MAALAAPPMTISNIPTPIAASGVTILPAAGPRHRWASARTPDAARQTGEWTVGSGLTLTKCLVPPQRVARRGARGRCGDEARCPAHSKNTKAVNDACRSA